MLSGAFANEAEVIEALADFLRTYAIDCLLICFLFRFVGFSTAWGFVKKHEQSIARK